MLFPTMTFAVFFVPVLAIGWRLRSNPQAWKLFMLGASYFFYGWWRPWYVLLLMASSVGNEVAANAIHRSTDADHRRRALVAGVVFNLGILAYFKYAGFLVEQFVGIGRIFGADLDSWLIDVILPVAVSFFTFCGMSYVIDVYRGTSKPVPLLDVALYLAFFPHLVAGPIVRASEFMPQLHWRERLADRESVDVSRALRLIGRGLFKKVVIATYLDQAIVDQVFGAPNNFKSVDLLFAAYAYAVQLYADFSGYTDMAIGIALLLGIKFPQNFDRPYAAVSLQDFWRRWHMTLSRWLRDYLYIPLGGNRDGELRSARNLVLTMLLGGLWHGPSWVFVVWGLYHGLGLVLGRWLHLRRGAVVEGDATTQSLWRNPWVGRVATFHVVTLGWILFKTGTNGGSLGDGLAYIWRMFTAWGSEGVVTPLVVMTIAAMLVVQFLPPRVGNLLEVRVSRMRPIAVAVGFGVFLVVVTLLGPVGVAPFIYFQF